MRTTGAVWVIDRTTAKVRFLIGQDAATQTYPGKMSWGENELAVLFWPAESVSGGCAGGGAGGS